MTDMNQNLLAPSRRFLIGMALLLVASIAACTKPAATPRTAAEFDRATANMDHKAMADYVFKTYECSGCHVPTAKGEAGFTARGEQAKQGFVGCVRLLTTINGTLGTDTANWTADEQHKHAQFKEFGCTFCHEPAPGKMGFTELGQKLGSLHLGCPEVHTVASVGG